MLIMIINLEKPSMVGTTQSSYSAPYLKVTFKVVQDGLESSGNSLDVPAKDVQKKNNKNTNKIPDFIFIRLEDYIHFMD